MRTSGSEEERDGTETPRLGLPGEREREREFLESLRSPEPPSEQRASVGGWGLGTWNEEGKYKEEDDEDEQLDWDQAQVCLRFLSSYIHWSDMHYLLPWSRPSLSGWWA